MLVPLSSRTSQTRDMANNILTELPGANRSDGLDEYQLGLTEIFLSADILAFLENLDEYTRQTTRTNKHSYERYIDIVSHCITEPNANFKHFFSSYNRNLTIYIAS